MKNNLPGVSFTHVRSTYIPLLDGSGCTCDNCNRLIANIVTVKNEVGKHYTIGSDCAKNILSKNENELISKNVKDEKRRLINAPKIDRQRIWDIAYKDLRVMENEAGINNSNINEQWSRDKYNELLLIIEAKHNIERFSYRR